MKKSFLMLLSVLYTVNIASNFEINMGQEFDQVYKLTPDDITQAKEKLVQQARYTKYARRSIIGVGVGLGVGLAGLFVYKMLPAAKSKKIDLVKQDSPVFPGRNVPADLLYMSQCELDLIDVQKEQTALRNELNGLRQNILEGRSWSAWFKNTGISLGVGMAPSAVSMIYKKLFLTTDILQYTTYKLGLPACFHQLRVAQTQWDPQAFISHAGHKSEPELIAYAHDLVRRFADMSPTKIIAIKQEAHKLFVAECSHLVKQVGGVIAYMQYTADFAEHVGIQNMLQDCADSLSLQVNEFVLKIRVQIAAQDLSGLANSVTLFQTSLSTSIKQFANLTNKLSNK